MNKTESILKKPIWLRTKLPSGENYTLVKRYLKDHKIDTVCIEANCPNVAECWGSKTATFMILGDVCTRNCLFCKVKHGLSNNNSGDESSRIANAVRFFNLKYVVITSVTRDDLDDGGAQMYVDTIRQIRSLNPEVKIELLMPDFCGEKEAITKIVEMKPEVIGHNIETVKELYPETRDKATYERTLQILKMVKEIDNTIITKSAILVGLGEHYSQIEETIHDLKKSRVDIVYIGQYLQPTRKNVPVQKYYSPSEFYELEKKAELIGFSRVQSSPLVRSSYKAHESYRESLKKHRKYEARSTKSETNSKFK
ncbi:lipoyl synthase [Chlamydiota bacterium]